jgi:protein required for attachment to host cells
MSSEAHAALQRLAQVVPTDQPVISVYLHTRVHDEHHRDRVRVFVENESRRVAAMAAGATEAELAWIRDQAEQIANGVLYAQAESVALFAGGSPALRETILLAVPVPDTFAVGDTPRLRPLVSALTGTPRGLVVFIDGERARLITTGEDGSADEVVLQHDDMVVGHHRRGGWALLLQSKYAKHLQVHRDRHFAAVAEALVDTVARYGTTAIVLAGEPQLRAAFRAYLSPDVARAIIGEIAAAHYEPAAALVSRALAVISLAAGSAQGVSLDAALVDAGAGGRAAAGVDATLEAVNAGNVMCLYLLDQFADDGAVCTACAAVQRGGVGHCRWCGKAVRGIDLGEALAQRVLAAGGSVEGVRAHAGLASSHGIAAVLRYAPVPQRS